MNHFKGHKDSFIKLLKRCISNGIYFYFVQLFAEEWSNFQFFFSGQTSCTKIMLSILKSLLHTAEHLNNCRKEHQKQFPTGTR